MTVITDNTLPSWVNVNIFDEHDNYDQTVLEMIEFCVIPSMLTISHLIVLFGINLLYNITIRCGMYLNLSY